jgi:hypothetical protein
MKCNGSILSVIVSFRNNRSLLKNQYKFFNKDRLEGSPPVKNHTLKFTEVSKLKLDRIKKQIRHQSKLEEQKHYIVFFLIILGLLTVFWSLYWILFIVR